MQIGWNVKDFRRIGWGFEILQWRLFTRKNTIKIAEHFDFNQFFIFLFFFKKRCRI